MANDKVVSVRLSPELYKAVKIWSIVKERRIYAIIAEAVQEYIDKQSNQNEEEQ